MRLGDQWIVKIDDITPQVIEQRAWIETKELANLMTPAEAVYTPCEAACRAIGLIEDDYRKCAEEMRKHPC